MPVDDNRSGERPAQGLAISRDPIASPSVDDGRTGKRAAQDLTPPGGVPFQPPRSQIGADTKPPADDRRSARDYVELAETAITKGRIRDALDLIEKAQTRLLDRSVGLDQTFDPITDEPIKKLSAARKALVDKDQAAALADLGSALAGIR